MIWVVIAALATVFWITGGCSLILHKQSKYIAALRKNIEQIYSNLEAVRGERDKLKTEHDKLKTEHDKKLASQRKQYEDKLAEKDKRVESIVNELSHIRWNRKEQGRYYVTVEFDPRMLGFGGPGGFIREDLFYIAKYLGDQVSHEIASSKFVQKANEEEREQYERRYRRGVTF
jgi:DNA gyrase/topoisomerase IV subunit A